VLEEMELIMKTHPYILKDSEVKTKLNKFIVEMNTTGMDPLKFQEFKQSLKLYVHSSF
jgi:hypothetical protein